MSVWFATASKRPPSEAEACLSKWREQGYKIALWRDPEDEQILCDLLLVGTYPGYHAAANALIREAMVRDPEAAWFVTAGDDMEPDPNKRADEIAAECTAHFSGTFGVMQPLGDMKVWPNSRIDTICGSPFMGREFCRRMYGGRGPWCELYTHMWGDQELHDLALKMGVLWKRDDLSHQHNHFQRGKCDMSKRPAWMVRNDECYRKYEPLFRERKRLGYPGHEPIA